MLAPLVPWLLMRGVPRGPWGVLQVCCAEVVPIRVVLVRYVQWFGQGYLRFGMACAVFGLGLFQVVVLGGLARQCPLD